MPRKPDPEAQVSIGWPILPHGVTVAATVKLSDLQAMVEHLLGWARENERQWKTLPVCGPDVVPGGNPAYVADDVEWMETRKVGF